MTTDPNARFDLSRRTVIGLAAAVGMGVAVSSHEPNSATKAELAELARNHVYYEVAMLRTATSTTTTVRLPIRCQQATST